MRTTIDIDDALLAVARDRALQSGVSLGRAVSDLIRRGLATPSGQSANGFPTFTPPPGSPVVTDDLVERYRDDSPTA